MAKQFTGPIVTMILQTYRLPQCSALTLSRIQSRCKLFCLCETSMRKFSSRTISNDKLDNNVMDKKFLLRKNVDQSLSNTLSSILSIDKDEALEIINRIVKAKSIKNVTEDDIIHAVTIAHKAGVSVFAIKNNISLLINNKKLLEEKFRYLNRLSEDINELLPLLDTNINYLRTLIISDIIECGNGKNKFRYLADELEVDIYKLCKAAANVPTIFITPVNKIKGIMDVLKEYDFDKKSIFKNLWLFKYSPTTIRKRSFRVKQAGVGNLKPWIIRCSLNGLHRYLTASKREEQLENVYGSHVSLISKKLNIPVKEVEFFIKRSPNILEIHLDKISQVLDILLKYEYNAVDILSCPRIFLIKAELLQERLEQLRKLRGDHRLTLVYCSNKTFEMNLKRASTMYKEEDASNSTSN